ncbi:natural killer cell receptor 2B4-like [Misgurnus anguillicaudatus]|uniref:natural killer cell receptor 2B4-like n=1 Tax=Misgurnus anguillicaudatus TaxID=75329 RepID=UPI003CCFB7CD
MVVEKNQGQTSSQGQEGDLIQWWLEIQHIADVTKQGVTINDNIIKDRIEFDHQTGSLTIKNMRIKDSGDYECYIKKGNTLSPKCFTVTVHDALPLPDIRRVSSSSLERSSSLKCVLSCSALNVRDVSLSWYKGNSLLYNISESDLNISLSLPLEVEYQDTNTYSCVLNNPITNQTQHLNITDLCQPFPGSEETSHTHSNWIVLPVVLVVAMMLAATTPYIFCKRKHNQDNGRLNRDETSAPLADSNEV